MVGKGKEPEQANESGSAILRAIKKSFMIISLTSIGASLAWYGGQEETWKKRDSWRFPPLLHPRFRPLQNMSGNA